MPTDEPDEATAGEVLEVHVRNDLGLCGGCLDVWGRYVPHPCTQAEWAMGVKGIGRPRPAPVLPVHPPNVGGHHDRVTIYPSVNDIWRRTGPR